jgi:hypothetical protein
VLVLPEPDPGLAVTAAVRLEGLLQDGLGARIGKGSPATPIRLGSRLLLANGCFLYQKQISTSISQIYERWLTQSDRTRHRSPCLCDLQGWTDDQPAREYRTSEPEQKDASA